jgi:hypothetical protein
MEKEKEEEKKERKERKKKNKKYSSGAEYASIQLYKRGRHIIIK